jgi:membrane-associated protease RseP (regulator of RpoE activity)
LFDIGIAGPLCFRLALRLIALVCGWLGAGAAVGVMVFKITAFPTVGPLVHAPAFTTWNPMLWAAWGALLITALNLFPVGQLDGGHVLYAIAGRRIHKWVSAGTSLAVACLAVIAFAWYGSPIWILWTVVLLFLTKVGHPPLSDEEPLGTTRTVLAVLAVLVFILCFMWLPIGTA